MKVMFTIGFIILVYLFFNPIVGVTYLILWYILLCLMLMADEQKEIEKKQRHKPPPPKPKPKESKTIIMEYDEQTERFTQKKVTV